MNHPRPISGQYQRPDSNKIRLRLAQVATDLLELACALDSDGQYVLADDCDALAAKLWARLGQKIGFAQPPGTASKG